MIIVPAAAKMVEGENMLENFLKGKIPSFKDGGSAESSKNISDENLNMIETVLTDLYKREGREVFDDDKVTRIALSSCKSKINKYRRQGSRRRLWRIIQKTILIFLLMA